ncbi:lipocalin family protein [Flavobacterium sp.]|uniref:lipocalin family protein n=1 Tax=Flavobacterium sp. TaxID=239 RepID=UPI003B99EC45
MKKWLFVLACVALFSCDDDENAPIQQEIVGLWRVESAVIYGDVAAIVPYDCQVTFNLSNQTVTFDEDFNLPEFSIPGNSYDITGNGAQLNFNNKTFRYYFENNKLILNNNPSNQDAKPVITLGRIE